MQECPSFNKFREVLKALAVLVLSGVTPGVLASEWCDLKYQAVARGQWAVVHESGEHFVFRTRRQLLELPAPQGVDTYIDVAEDAALESLTAYLTQRSPVNSGQLQVRNAARPQRIRCPKAEWIAFIFDLAKVSWVRSEATPAVPVVTLPSRTTPPASTPVTAPAAKTRPSSVKTIEE
jgi:hypothetical protein